MQLLTPLQVGSHTVRNRLMFGPHETNLGRRRAISERHVAYYRRRAAGGAGLVVTEEASIHPSDWPYERAPLAADCGPGWAAVAGACHAEGATVVAAIGHAGGQGSSAYNQAPLWAPSRVPEVNSREVPKWMEKGDVLAVIDGFAAATRVALASGMDGVEINAGQHSLVRQFLSGLTNHRGDEWGADRSLFARQVLETVRTDAGAGVVGLRLSCDELAPWAGITPEAATELAVALVPYVDYLVVVRGSIYTVAATRPDGHTPPGFNRDLTAAVRTALAGAVAPRAAAADAAPVGGASVADVRSGTAAAGAARRAGVPVYWQGSIVDPADAEAGLAAGVCDGVEMTRAQIADPDLAAKLGRGEAERVRPCILCNQTCMVRDPRNPLVSCVVEPSAGHETEDPPVGGDTPAAAAPAPARRREAHPELLVVGAGPAGLECARVAALGGRSVRVADRRPATGGMTAVAATASGRHHLAAFVTWLDAECRRLGVRIDLEHAVGAEEIYDHDGDVILATGSRRDAPTYRIEPGAIVLSARELLESTMPLAVAGDADTTARQGPPDATGPRRGAAVYDDRDLPAGPALVWDPLGGPIGVSVAETLAEVGRPVTLATPDTVVGTQLSRTGDLAPANVRLQQAGVTLVKRVDLVEVKRGAARLVDRFSAEETTLEAALVVDAGAALPDDRLWEATDGRGRGLRDPASDRRGLRDPAGGLARAGDAVAPRTIHEAVLEGRRAAQAVLSGAGTRRLRPVGATEGAG